MLAFSWEALIWNMPRIIHQTSREECRRLWFKQNGHPTNMLLSVLITFIRLVQSRTIWISYNIKVYKSKKIIQFTFCTIAIYLLRLLPFPRYKGVKLLPTSTIYKSDCVPFRFLMNISPPVFKDRPYASRDKLT